MRWTTVRRGALAAAALLGLTACAVGPDYHRPITPLRPFHNVGIIAPSSGTRENDVAWWTSFGDPELNRIETRVLAMNLDLRAAFARVLQGRAVARSAAAQMLPTIDLNPQVSATRLSEEGLIGHIVRQIPHFNRDYREYNVGGVASWELDVAGGLRRAHEAARDEFQAAEAEQAGVRVSIAAEAADTYFRIRGIQLSLQDAREAVDASEKLLDLVQQRHDRGVADDRERSQAAAALETERQRVLDIERQKETHLNRLDVLMGAQPGTYAGELETTTELPVVPKPAVAAQSLDVLRRRPDVLASERRLAARNADIGVALAAYYPKISLQGALGFESMSPRQLFVAPGFQPTATGALRWRIFDFGKISSEVARARGNYAEALADYRSTMLHAAEDVENAFFHLSQTHRILASETRDVNALERVSVLTQQSYATGAMGLGEVLQSRLSLLKAQETLTSTRAEELRAAVECFRAMGGGWRI
ncbi:efflux transporter outer membrane subunit [Acetobacter estunensis]|uniref:Efflux transporter outer membrane subunit n=1 Tax=Acetobacter estunensis TaxID=104097 RepID=A0A967BB72_9PROT|nr:efflux transporter outer membrane subunit [Acetobacter estunensis]NHO55351.1 efflux transporter outer membrane subunit [Acetobacter estunensis]